LADYLKYGFSNLFGVRKGKKGGSKFKNRSIKYVCPECGAIIRATREVNVICGDCGVPFERE